MTSWFHQGLRVAGLPLLLLAIVALVLLAVVLLVRAAQLQDLADRLASADAGPAPAHGLRPTRLLTRMLAGLGNLAARRTGLFSEKELATFRNTLVYAGIDPKGNLPLLIGIKLVMAVGVPAVTWVAVSLAGVHGVLRELALLLSVVVGLRGAQIVLGLMGGPFIRAVRRGVPDALDLMVISVEAGLGLEAALERVSREMARSNPPAAMQLAALAEDLRVLPDRQMAFDKLGKRGIDDGMERLGAVLSQSLKFGTPLAQALRAISAELRRQRVITLEEKANRLPVLLVLPLVLFIMPCVVIVMVGPSMLSLFGALAHLHGGISIK